MFFSKIFLLFFIFKITRLFSTLINHILARLFNKKTFWNKYKNSWFAVTGCTDGIGRELSLQIAERGGNLVLISRNEQKLLDLKKEIEQKKVKCSIYVADFADPHLNFSLSENKSNSVIIKEDISVLFNNVGCSSNHAILLAEEDRINEIININNLNTVKLTQVLAKNMMLKRKGAIINIGSMLGNIPSPLLSVYAASKAFLKHFSHSLHYELLGYNVHVELIETALVSTKMSKIRKASYFVPSTKTYAKSVLDTIGVYQVNVPYFAHVLNNIIYNVVPEYYLGIIMSIYNNKVMRKAKEKKNKQK